MPKTRSLLILAAAAFAAVGRGTEAPPVPRVPELMEKEREIALALSAAPAQLRDGAAVWVLEENGFVKVRDSRNGFGCIVNRDHPLNRKPTCYDAEGVATILPKVLRVGELLMQGKPLAEINVEIQEGFRTGKFVSPRRPGVAYMLSGDIRRFDAASGSVVSFPPHVMFYAPNLTNEDIGSKGDGSDGLPFIAYQGPHGYMIMMPSSMPEGGSDSAHGGKPAAARAEPGPPSSQDPLAWTIGRWEGTRTETSTGKSEPLATVVEPVLGGAGEEERLQVGEGAHAYRGLYLQVSDPNLRKSAMTYVNGTRREFARLEGVADADGGSWESTTARPPHASRLRYQRIGADAWRRTQSVSEDSGRHWTVLFVDEMHRAEIKEDHR